MPYIYYFATIASSILAIGLFVFICFQAPSREQKVLQFESTCVMFLNLGDTISAITTSSESSVRQGLV